jgi:hypothetical protein
MKAGNRVHRAIRIVYSVGLLLTGILGGCTLVGESSNIGVLTLTMDLTATVCPETLTPLTSTQPPRVSTPEYLSTRGSIERATATITVPQTTIPAPIVSSPTLAARRISMTKIDEEPARSLRWSDAASSFIYAQFDPPHSRDPDAITWWSLNPTTREKQVYEPAVVPINERVQQQLDVYNGLMSFCPSGEHIVFIRAQETGDSGIPFPTFEYIELWYADPLGGNPTKLGDLSAPWDEIVWLDSNQAVLIVIYGESMDAGLFAFIYSVTGDGFTDLFEEGDADQETLQGVPQSISVSPNSRWIAVTVLSREIGIADTMWIIDRVEDVTRNIDSVDARVRPIWSENSQHLYYIQNDETYLPGSLPETSPSIARLDMITGQSRQLTSSGEIGMPLLSGWAVSGDGEYFLLSANWTLGFLDGGLWLVELDVN